MMNETKDEETIKVQWSVSTGNIGSEKSGTLDTGYSRAEWDELGEDEQNAVVQEYVFQFVTWDWSE